METTNKEKLITREDLTSRLFRLYQPIRNLSSKEKGKAILLRHKELDKFIVMRSYPDTIPVYDFLCSIDCSGIPRVYDTYLCSDGEIVLEEYVMGMTLAEALEVGLYEYKDAKKIIIELCTALGVLHENGYVHRDIKPENVLIPDDGVCKLIDFDASRTFSNEKTGDTTYLGTVGFASPEQFGISQSDARSDIYSLGILLNIMLTGSHPSDKLAKGKAGKIVQKCTMINPEKRFSSVEKLLAAL